MAEQIVIFTDLDGTLLDHYSYQWQAAQAMLSQLKCQNIPVIINTSKTKAELVLLRQQLGLTTPFIAENGAAIFMPIGCFTEQPIDTTLQDGYWVKSFCHSRIYWLQLLKQYGQAFSHCFQGFSQMSVELLSQLTGLEEQQALLAKTRMFGEPIHWTGTNEEKAAFIDLMTSVGANVLQGGRFLHISGYCDKGQALHWLAEQYRNNDFPDGVVTVALGDSDNDIAMLESANIAILIRSPVHDYPNVARHMQVIKSHAYGPQGWVETLEQLFPSLTTSGGLYG